MSLIIIIIIIIIKIFMPKCCITNIAMTTIGGK